MSAAHIYDEYEEMLRSFRCQDLITLLSFTGQSRNGKKAELYDRCLSILKRGNVTVQIKIKEIYNSRMTATSGSNYNSLLNAASSSNSSTSNSPDPNNMMISYHMPSSGRNVAFPNYAPSTSNSQYAYNNSLNSGYTRSTNSYQPNYSSLANAFMASVAPNLLSSGHELSNQSSNLNKNIKVVFEQLAFYEFLYEIDEPKKLLGVAPSNKPLSFSYNFFLNTNVVNQVIDSRQMLNGKFEYDKQIHLRFGYVETSEQKDVMPNNLILNVNGKPAQLPTPKPTSKPNADIVRPGRSIEITSICRLAPNVANKVDLSWTNSDPTKCYCVGAYLFRKISCNELMKNLTSKCVSQADLTRKMVMEKLGIGDDDLEIETPTLKVSLQCPLMKFRIRLPARSNKCTHVQCFDAESYLMMNEKKPTWNCPVCDIYAPYYTLQIDGLFKEILAQEKDAEEILFNADGTWTRVQESGGLSRSSTEDDLKQPSAAKEMSVDDDETTCFNVSDSNSPKTEKVTQSTSASKTTIPPVPKPTLTTNTIARVAQTSKDDDVIDLTADSDEEETPSNQQATVPSNSNAAQPAIANRLANASTGNQMSVQKQQQQQQQQPLSSSNKRPLAIDDDLTNEQLSQLLSEERRTSFNATINNLLLNKELQSLVSTTSNNLTHGLTASSNAPSANVITRIQDLFSDDEIVNAQANQPTSPSDSIISIYSDDQTDTPVASQQSQQQQEIATTNNPSSSFSKSRETQSPDSSTNSPISTPECMPSSNKFDSFSPLLSVESNQQTPHELGVSSSPRLHRPSLDEATANFLSPSHSGPGSPSIINRPAAQNKTSNNAIIRPPRLLNTANNASSLPFPSTSSSSLASNNQSTDESLTHNYKRSSSNSSSSSSSSSNKLNEHTTLNNRITQPVYRSSSLNKEKALKIVEEVRSNAVNKNYNNNNNWDKNQKEASYQLKSSNLSALISNTLKRNSFDTDLPSSSSSAVSSSSSSAYPKSNYHSNHNQHTHHNNNYQHQHSSYHHSSHQYPSNSHGSNDRNANNNNFNPSAKSNSHLHHHHHHHNYPPSTSVPYRNSHISSNNNSNNQFFLNNKPVSSNQIRSNNLGSTNNMGHNSNSNTNNRINQPVNNNRPLSYNNHSIPRP